MALKPLKRNYNMSDGNLLEISSRITYAGNRDLADLPTYGVAQATLDDIDEKAGFLPLTPWTNTMPAC